MKRKKGFLNKIGELNTWQMETYFEHQLVNPATGGINNNIILRGYADIINQPEKDQMRIAGIKTTAKSPNMEQANRALELTVYAYLLACNTGFKNEFPVSLLYKEKQPHFLKRTACRTGS